MNKYDCIIVLANEMDKDGILNAESMARVETACNFFFEGLSNKIITCGWDYRSDSDITIGEAMRNYAVKLGVPLKNIIIEINSRDTVGDALFTKINIINKMGWKKILVVTSSYHSDRSLAIFNYIYGLKFKIDILTNTGFDNYLKKRSEKKSLKAFKNTFKDIKAGDDEKVYDRLIKDHPYYNGLIYPQIDFI
jgi:vancomycin permeability regulator SanA